jgi:hypothetical protein
MRKALFPLLIAITLCGSCGKEDTDYTFEESGGSSSSDTRCGTYNGHQLYRGPQGGCYYINSNGNKSYVDRSKCTGC